MSVHPKAPTACEACGAVFTGGVHPRPRWCPTCRPSCKRQPGPRKYRWTAERDQVLRDRYDSRLRGRATAIAASLGWPAWVVKKRAQQLGLSRPWPAGRRDWTDHELRFLEQWSGRRASIWIARRLKRSETSVVVRQKRLDLCRRVRAGYTLRDLCAVFGVDHHTVARWADQGKLAVTRRQTGRTELQGDPWSIDEAAVVAFVRQHPGEVDLRKVDQAWFFDVIVATTAPASASPAATDAVKAVRRVILEMEPGEAFSTPEIHARVSLPAHDVRLALRALAHDGLIGRIWRRLETDLARRTA